jgi:PAS domain S-box-containing protein
MTARFLKFQPALWLSDQYLTDQRLTAIVDSSDDAIISKDLDGTIVTWNRGAERLFGYTAAEAVGQPVAMLIPEDRPDEEPGILQRIRRGERVDHYETVRRRKDGQLVEISLTVSPIKDKSGRIVGASKIARDITERKLTERRLRESNRQVRSLIEALPAAIYTTDLDGNVTYFNETAVEVAGRQPELGTDKWCVSWRLYHPDGTPMPHEECPMAVALRERRPVRGVEIVVERPDGSRIPVIPYPTPLFDESGELIGAVNMLVDISERKQAEMRVQGLLDELNHRVKNTLATVQSLATQSARNADSIEAFQEQFNGRLIALSRAHDQLSRRNWQQGDLLEIATAGLAPYRQDTAHQIAMSGESVRLAPIQALTLAMVFHELTTNAAKYGALSNPRGRLQVGWSTRLNGKVPTLKIFWRESGGPKVAPPARRGFGSRLIEYAVKSDLGGAATLKFDPAGVSCDIEMPVSDPESHTTGPAKFSSADE